MIDTLTICSSIMSNALAFIPGRAFDTYSAIQARAWVTVTLGCFCAKLPGEGWRALAGKVHVPDRQAGAPILTGVRLTFI